MRTVTLEARGLSATRPPPASATRPDPAIATAPAVGALARPVPPPAATSAPAPSDPAPVAAVAPPATAAPPAPRTAAPAAVPKVNPEVRHTERTPPPGSGWAVQLGVFGQRDNADRLVRDLRSRGFEAFVSPVSRPGSTLYRVRVGPEHDRDAAEQLARRLAAAGHRGPVVSM
jgi:cell division septation protein DedD